MENKFCEDCRNFAVNSGDQLICIGENAKRWGINLVRYQYYPLCANERSIGNCGTEGKLFLSKETEEEKKKEIGA